MTTTDTANRMAFELTSMEYQPRNYPVRVITSAELVDVLKVVVDLSKRVDELEKKLKK